MRAALLRPARRRRIERAAIARVGAAQDRVKQERVLDCAGERSDRLEVGEDRGKSVGARPAADRGLEADKAGVAGGTPDRTAAVRADRSRDKARRDARRRAAGRAAGREIRVPGVARDAEQVVARIALKREFRHVRLADDDHARRAQPRDRQFVLRRPIVLERAAAPCRRKAGDMDIVFDGDRNSVEPGIAPRPASDARRSPSQPPARRRDQARQSY